MRRSARPVRELLLITTALVLLAGCSGNNKNNKNNNQATAPVAATIAAARTPTPAATTARTATPTIAARTPTPAAAVRTPTPAAAAAARTGTPAAATGTDAAQQKAISDAALKAEDLPSGFKQQGDAETTADLPGQTAGYTVTYLNTTSAIAAVIVGIAGFRDASTSAANFQNLKSQITSGSGADFTLQSISTGPKLGDESQSYQVSGSSSGIPLGGYAITWRRGKVDVAVVYIGAPAVSSIDQVAALAQKQDDKLKAAGQ